MNPTRVVLVDDHPLFRRGVAQLLSESQRFDMLEEFGNAEELLQNLERLDPELLLIDLQMPGTSGLSLLEQIKAAGADVVGVDWRISLDVAWKRVGFETAVQGNLDPAALLGPFSEVKDQARDVLDRAGGRPGHVFNLGHGLLPNTPLDNIVRLVDFVHEWSSRPNAEVPEPERSRGVA